ncbi:T-cell immunoglobulin and mucin domain-containing protein 4 [Pygocentrus nattereri]|uniref:T cell immunoglobulin and mucin domain containing 4 n=1 Tax=Pygocentrus nattereri TaxID=42514 RepID=A0A3B4C8N3_PYGNA|nr:T-cell immunoglobulin and mucin domain-containing protein 4 [Pygocentrus nattereri]
MAFGSYQLHCKGNSKFVEAEQRGQWPCPPWRCHRLRSQEHSCLFTLSRCHAPGSPQHKAVLPKCHAPSHNLVRMAASHSFYLLHWILVLSTLVARSSVMAFKVTEGSTVILSCHYSVKQHGLRHVCWGRDCGTFWCNDIIVQTDENGVISKVSDRYRLIGDVLSGQMDLGIQRIQRTDSGPYCCRTDIDGLFNDKKVTYTLKVMRAPTTVPPTTTTSLTTEPLPTQTVPHLSDPPRETEASRYDISRQNLTILNLGGMAEEAVPNITLQINIPVLSLSLSILLLLLGALALMVFKCGFHMKVLESGCLSNEPRHIIYEIRTRRPVEENIYTLD